MVLDAWLPIGFALPDGAQVRTPKFAGMDWQVLDTRDGGHALVVREALAQRWLRAGLVETGTFAPLPYGTQRFWALSCATDQTLCPVGAAQSPNDKAEALAFALALKATRAIDPESGLQGALYVEAITRLLPTYEDPARADDAVVLGGWLTGGAGIPATSLRSLSRAMSWMDTAHIRDIVQAAGFAITESTTPGRPQTRTAPRKAGAGEHSAKSAGRAGAAFALAGRPALAAFFNEHVIDIVQNRERYQALGVGFPSAVILHGPPGCGKTFAVERLADFLGWPSFQVDANSIASPYIHETSKKIAQIFEEAIAHAPSVLIIDEMEAFLADREMGGGGSHHRVEEMAEFLRRIPEAVLHDVLIVAMTNRIDMIDPAILRRGRFDHIIKVDFASEIEVRALLDQLLATVPVAPSVDGAQLARALTGRPLSDIAFVVREGARLAARAGKAQLDQDSLQVALLAAPPRSQEDGGGKRRIGFI